LGGVKGDFTIMNKYIVKVEETYVYWVDVEANNKNDALQRIKDGYEARDEKYDGIFVADATTHDNATFKVVKERYE
jgi:16S rRNA U516 pseudouridylate synthase RsuA-like enzyme